MQIAADERDFKRHVEHAANFVEQFGLLVVLRVDGGLVRRGDFKCGRLLAVELYEHDIRIRAQIYVCFEIPADKRCVWREIYDERR